MSDVNMEKFAVPEFIPDRYVKDLAKSCVGGEELQQQKEKIQNLADETASALKKNVYENYMQFIETATEISHLEAEMYKLSHLLSEQRTVLTTLSQASILGNDNTISRESLDNHDLEAERAEEQQELDVLIVERHFQKTYELMVSAQKLLNSDEFKIHPQRDDILKRIEQKQKALTDILLKELDSVITVQKVGLQLVTKDMMDVLDECIHAVFNSRLMLSIGNDSSYAQNNFKFILDTVMPLMLRCYKEEVGYDNEKLMSLGKKFGVKVSSPKKSNITKYTSNEYL
ncbi:unnamed protein product, partial [Iphiclides podalirius]